MKTNQNTADLNQRSQFSQWPALLCTVLLTVLYALNFIQSVVVLDTARDLFYATEISQYGNWPLLGPDIGGFFHTGPLWFYILALPALTGSLYFLAFFVGVLAGLKFFIAYRLGAEILDQKLGLLWAFMLLLPGWHVINQMMIGHFNVLETLALLLLLVLYKFYQTGASKYWVLAAITLGLGFQAHPSFLALLIFYLPVMWQRWRQLSPSLFLLAGIGFMLPLLPYIYDQLFNGMMDFERWTDRSQDFDQIRATGKSILPVPWWQHWLENMGSMLITGPQRINEFVQFHVPGIGNFMRYFYPTVMLLTAVGTLLVFKQKKLFKVYALTLSGLFIALLVVSLMRSFTPFYMLLSLTPVLAGLYALGAYCLLQHTKTGRVFLMSLLFLLGFAPFFAVHKAYKHQQISLGPVMNITQQTAEDWLLSPVTLDALNVKESRVLSEIFCDRSSVINGPFAPVLEMTGGATLQFFCDEFELQLGGRHTHQKHSLFLMHKYFWDLMGQQPDSWVSPSWGRAKNYQNHSHHHGLNLVPFDPYVHPPRSNQSFASHQVMKKNVVTDNGPYLVFTNVLPAYMTFSVTDITANGLPAELLVANAANRLYHCSSCGVGAVNWQFQLKTNYVDGIDINTLPE